MSELKHYGMPRRSGRYPWGSGEDPYQSSVGFRGMVSELRSKGLSEKEIAQGLGMSIAQLRARITVAREEVRAAQVAEAIRLQSKGMSNVAIGDRMGIPESSVRSLLDPTRAERAAITQTTANMLKQSVEKFGYIDVGSGVENHVGVSRNKLNTAVLELEAQGYNVHTVKITQVGTGKPTTLKVLAPPSEDPHQQWKEIVRNPDLIQPVMGRSEDHGRTFSNLGIKPIESISSDKIMVRYGEEGKLKDGVIELRRGVDNLDLGDARYAQVRVGVDGTHYMKGMALYSDDMPDGIDIIYNTNKPIGTPKLDVMKPMKKDLEGNIDADNPFGATIGAQRGALNLVGTTGKIHEEGTWDTWSKTLSSQMLSKQPQALIKEQLGLAYQLKREEYDDIMSVTNPAVKKLLLEKFADGCDSDAVHLRGAAMPRQATKVLLPITSLKENEAYVPGFNNGETVVLIRHPHAGPFEIPQLTVNNKSKEARSILGIDNRDAIGVNPEVAKKLSGADFDGDTVIVIPNPAGKIKSAASLDGLKDFDPIESYRIPEGSKIPKINPSYMQNQMGVVSNLITDMTIMGANENEIARAVRHSMVIIDSEKHNLNYRQSYIDNGIASLAEKYQGKIRGGASTIISRASSEIRIDEIKPGAAVGPISKTTGKPTKLYIDPKTGEKLYTKTGATRMVVRDRVVKTDPSGRLKSNETAVRNADGTFTVTSRKEEKIKTITTRMAVEKDALVLSSGTPKEALYANHANQLKALGNTARKEMVATQTTPYSPSANKVYKQEVESLIASLDLAKRNRPLERQAQIIARTVADKKLQSSPPMDKDDETKIRNQALTEARARVGAKRDPVPISPKEWEAIQAGAISNNTLVQILNNTNLDVVKQYATPRQEKISLSSGKLKRARAMLSSGATQSEVAQALGVSVSVLVEELYK